MTARRRLLLAGGAGAAFALAAIAVFVVAAGRLLVPPAPLEVVSADADARALTEGYAVWSRDADGTPVRWDPCSPIRWVLDATAAPDGARETISLAMARISAVSGLEFEFVGHTQETPTMDRSLMTDDVSESWAPVLITWVPGSSTDLPLGDDERGVTVPVAVRDGGRPVFVTGQIALNADKTLLPGFEDRHASWGAVVLHELAHLVGLDHVEDPAQLMNPTPGFGPVTLGDGDRAGLLAVGAEAGCLEVPAPQHLDVTVRPPS